MKLKTLSMLGTLICLFALSTQAQIRVADDSSSGTYKKMLGEIIGVCSGDVDITEAQNISGGAPGNLDALFNNKADAAFLHSDVYFANAQADPAYNKLQTLVALYPEPIHVLALRNSKTGKAGTFTMGKQEFNSLADAKGFKVGAAGGGVFTARVLTGQGQGGFTVVSYDTGDQVIAALNNGDIAMGIFVGAAPLPNIEKLDKNTYKLLTIGATVAANVKGVYRVASINYRGLTNGPLETLAPIATLLTRKFSTPAKIDLQARLRACFTKHIGELTDMGSPNWQDVTPGDHGVLPWLEITGVPATSLPVAAPKAKR